MTDESPSILAPEVEQIKHRIRQLSDEERLLVAQCICGGCGCFLEDDERCDCMRDD